MKMEAHIAAEDLKMFKSYLERATHYFEWGAGGSTYVAAQQPNLLSVASIESDRAWFNRVQQVVREKPHVNLRLVDLKGSGSWGSPGASSTEADWIAYNGAIREVDMSATPIDLIMIDGRFRVACCLKCFDVIGENCIILFDDFLDRSMYHCVLGYYDILEKTSDKRMVALKKRPGAAAPSRELIQQYERKKD